MTDDRTTMDIPAPRLDELRTGMLIAIIDGSDEAIEAVQAASQACTSEWACSCEPYVVEAADVLAQDRATRHGLAARAYRFLAALVSDQGHLRHRAIEEAQLGHHVVVIGASDGAQVDRMWSELRRHGAHDGVYIGANTTRELV
jgi:hypothetical protein